MIDKTQEIFDYSDNTLKTLYAMFTASMVSTFLL